MRRSLLFVQLFTTAARASFVARSANACACEQVFLAAETARIAVELGSHLSELPGELLFVARLAVIVIAGLCRFLRVTRATAKMNRFDHLFANQNGGSSTTLWRLENALSNANHYMYIPYIYTTKSVVCME